jgi:hypothetical protein
VAVLLSITSAAHAQPATEDIKSKAQRLVAPLIETRDSRLRPVATFDHQVTGVTVAPDGRIFANSPRWTEERFPWPNSCRTVRLSRTLMKNGTPGAMPRCPKFHQTIILFAFKTLSLTGAAHFRLSTQRPPNAEKTVKGGPKVVEIDLKSSNVKRIFPIGPDVAGPASYLTIIRIAPNGRFHVASRTDKTGLRAHEEGRRCVGLSLSLGRC